MLLLAAAAPRPLGGLLWGGAAGGGSRAAHPHQRAPASCSRVGGSPLPALPVQRGEAAGRGQADYLAPGAGQSGSRTGSVLCLGWPGRWRWLPGLLPARVWLPAPGVKGQHLQPSSGHFLFGRKWPLFCWVGVGGKESHPGAPRDCLSHLPLHLWSPGGDLGPLPWQQTPLGWQRQAG